MAPSGWPRWEHFTNFRLRPCARARYAGGMDRRARIVTAPTWAASVGGMLEAGAIVTGFCERCGGSWRKDQAWLERLAAEKGAGFSLWGLRPPCWTPACPGRLILRASPWDTSGASGRRAKRRT